VTMVPTIRRAGIIAEGDGCIISSTSQGANTRLKYNLDLVLGTIRQIKERPVCISENPFITYVY
jgi:hypothetical protein